MKKVFVFFVAMFVMISATVAQVSVWDGTHSTWTQGTGTESNPYLIENAKQLAYLAVYINGGGTSSGQYWKLIIDIDLNSLQWTPIGGNKSFEGHFDGDGHTIANLVVQASPAGLFGRIQGGRVQNIGIIGSSSMTGGNVGGIVGDAYYVTINNCYNTGSISAIGYGGGIIGHTDGYNTINNCYNTGMVWVQYPYDYAGGIIGGGGTIINNCYNTGHIGCGDCYGGGISGEGELDVIITNCYNVGYAYYGITRYGADVTNSYYLNTCVVEPGGGIPKTAEFMKIQEFVDLLNNGPTPNFAYKLDELLINGGYPVHSNFKLQTLPATNVAKTTATLNGTLDFGNTAISQQGFIFSNNGVEETIYAPISGNSVSYNISGLTANTTYQYKIFAIANSNTYWGEYVTFTTPSFNQDGNAFLIENQADLIRLANLVNAGNKYVGQEFILANDIDLPNTPNNILSIGTKVTDCPFSGIFNGNGKHIRNVYIDNPNTPYQGLFGYTKDAGIQNLGIENITASGRDYTGGMIGYAENTKLDTLYVKGGTLHSLSYCGGLIGYQTAGTKSVITVCYNHGCSVKGNNYVGGLLGYSDQGTVRSSWVAADVSGQGDAIGAVIGGAFKVLYYNCWFNSDYQCPSVDIGENIFKSGSRGGMTSEQMRSPEFVKTLNEGLVTPAWKIDYNPPINNGFPILIWQTNLPPEEIEENSENSMITIYPNPTSGELIIDCRDAINRVFTTDYHIFNMMGQTVMQGRL